MNIDLGAERAGDRFGGERKTISGCLHGNGSRGAVGKQFEHFGDWVEPDHGAGQPGDQEPRTTTDVKHRCGRNVVECRSEPIGRGERCSDSGVTPVDGCASIDRGGDRVQAHRLTSPLASPGACASIR